MIKESLWIKKYNENSIQFQDTIDSDKLHYFASIPSLIHKPTNSQPSVEVDIDDAQATKIVGHENIAHSDNTATMDVVRNVHETQHDKSKKNVNIKVLRPVPTMIKWGASNECHIGISISSEFEFGFPWANNSCGFDSVVSGLWFIFNI